MNTIIYKGRPRCFQRVPPLTRGCIKTHPVVRSHLNHVSGWRRQSISISAFKFDLRDKTIWNGTQHKILDLGHYVR